MFQRAMKDCTFPATQDIHEYCWCLATPDFDQPARRPQPLPACADSNVGGGRGGPRKNRAASLPAAACRRSRCVAQPDVRDKCFSVTSIRQAAAPARLHRNRRHLQRTQACFDAISFGFPCSAVASPRRT
jgi:hypothetical protein